MAFIRVTDKSTGGVRCFNSDFIVELQPDEAGATLWYVSYATAGQPVSKYVDTEESLDDLLGQARGAGPAASSAGG